MAIKADDFAFTVHAIGQDFDVYHFKQDEKDGTLAFTFSKARGQWVIALFCAGHLTAGQVVERLQEGHQKEKN